MKALDANGKRVGYGTASIRMADTRSLAFNPKGNRFSDRFSVHITNVPSATTGFDFRVLNHSNGQVIAARNYSTKPSSYDNGAINVISVCAQGCNVSAALKPGTSYHVEIIAKEVMYEISRLRKSVRTKAVTLGNAAPAQAAPASEPTATPAPIVLAAGIHNASEVSLQWSAVSGATGYKLEYAGSDMTSGSFTLGAGATSQRITGLSPGVNYKATLTATLSGGERSGEIHFVMPNPPPPPTNTPVPPPTNTPVPPPTNTPVPPPTNTPVPPPTNTPVPPPTNTPVPPPTNTPVPPAPQQTYSVPGRLIQTVRDYYDTNVAAGRTGNNWLRVLIAFGVETHDELSPMSASEARERVSRWSGWKPIAEALEQLEG